MPVDSTMVTPRSSMVGALPSGCTARSESGERPVRSRVWCTILYSSPSSSSSQRTTCECDWLRWCAVIIDGSVSG